jgi:hypothetical protein
MFPNGIERLRRLCLALPKSPSALLPLDLTNMVTLDTIPLWPGRT